MWKCIEEALQPGERRVPGPSNCSSALHVIFWKLLGMCLAYVRGFLPMLLTLLPFDAREMRVVLVRWRRSLDLRPLSLHHETAFYG